VSFLANGNADIVMLDTPQVFQAVNAEQPISLVYEASQFSPEGIVVPNDSDIRTAADLIGKTIGLGGDRDQITVMMSMAAVGKSIDDVRTVVVGGAGPVLANAITGKQIDAFAGAGQDFRAIEATGMVIRDVTPAETTSVIGNTFAI